MLILSRRNGEAVVCRLPGTGRTITVRVMEIRQGSGSVRLGFEADKDIVILREEIMPLPPEIVPPGARIVSEDDGTP